LFIIYAETSKAIRAVLKELSVKEIDNSWHSYLEKVPAWAGQALLAPEFEVRSIKKMIVELINKK
jgi:hypothetical protein